MDSRTGACVSFGCLGLPRIRLTLTTMPDVFISYSSKDSDLARWLRDQLTAMQVNTFLAEVSVPSGHDWKAEILEQLRTADFVLFLATPNSCASDAVKHEIGGALVLQKTFVPIMADIKAHQLPAWIKDKQAVDIKDSAGIRKIFERIADTPSSKQFITGELVSLLFF